MDTNINSDPLSDGQVPAHPQGPGLDFKPAVPSSLEGSFEIPNIVAPKPVAAEAAPVVPIETALPQESVPLEETYSAPETVHTFSAPVVEEIPEDTPVPVVPVTLPVSVAEHVVDKRTNHERLNAVDKTADETTRFADDEEEDFIEGVEHAHEPK